MCVCVHVDARAREVSTCKVAVCMAKLSEKLTVHPALISRLTRTGADFVEVTEGTATMLFPADGEVFYNPVQEFNRDLSIAVLCHFSSLWREEQAALHMKRVAAHAKAAEAARVKSEASAAAITTGTSASGDDAAMDEGAASAKTHAGDNPQPHTPAEPAPFAVLEALSATGLRAVRYFNEVDGLDHVVANDMSADAVASIHRNVRYNKLDPEHQVVPNKDDAISLMYRHRERADRFPVVDLDPYGSAGPFLDAAVQAVDDGGLLCVTCTDMAVLAGNHGEACFAKYGSMSVRSAHCKEMAVRIILYVVCVLIETDR